MRNDALATVKTRRCLRCTDSCRMNRRPRSAVRDEVRSIRVDFTCQPRLAKFGIPLTRHPLARTLGTRLSIAWVLCHLSSCSRCSWAPRCDCAMRMRMTTAWRAAGRVVVKEEQGSETVPSGRPVPNLQKEPPHLGWE